MIVYNVSIKVQPEVVEEWAQWMKNVHLPEVMETGCFQRCDFYRLHVQEEDGLTFVAQYHCVDIEILEHYQKTHGPSLRQKTEELFGGKYIAFRTTMEAMMHISLQDLNLN